jgi:hypothetical protein
LSHDNDRLDHPRPPPRRLPPVAQNGGESAIPRFGGAHDITSSQAWVTAFVLMAFTEVVIPPAPIGGRGLLARRGRTAPPPTPVRTMDYSA